VDFVRLEKRQRLIDAVLFVTLGFLNVAALDQFDYPARVEIDAEGDASAMLPIISYPTVQVLFDPRCPSRSICSCNAGRN